MTPIQRPVTHIGYVVDDLDAGIRWAIDTLGAGPFFVNSHMKFDSCTFNGQPAAYDHSSAFGRWGDIIVELTVVHSADPPELAQLLGAGQAPKVGHVGWLSDDLEADSAALEAAGMPLFHTGAGGPIAAHWHDGRAQFGHHVEILTRSPLVEGFYARIRESAEGWDGSDPVRPGPSGDPALPGPSSS